MTAPQRVPFTPKRPGESWTEWSRRFVRQEVEDSPRRKHAIAEGVIEP